MASTDDIAQAASVSSRPTTSGFGKCNVPAKTLLTDEINDDFTRKWRLLGYGSSSDALRELVIVFTYGHEYLTKVHTDRIAALARNVSGIGPELGS
jgi:hypothetical protein